MDNKNNYVSVVILILIFSLISPVLIIPIAKLLPYPYIVEEVFKAIVVLMVLKVSKVSLHWKLLIISGLVFSLSESILYLGSVFGNGHSLLFAKKLLSTTFLHVVTLFIIYTPTLINRRLIGLGLLLAMYIHFLFNSM